jgi:hypothetical protein
MSAVVERAAQVSRPTRLGTIDLPIPKLDVAGSTPVARSRRKSVEDHGFFGLRRQRVVALDFEGSG